MPRKSREDTVRCEIVRTRLEDWIDAHAGSRSATARLDAQRLAVRRTIRLGRERGMHLWSDKTMPLEDAGLCSLQYLLKERSSPNPKGGQPNTGGNRRWVLDLWEAMLGEGRANTVALQRTRASAENKDECGVVVEAKVIDFPKQTNKLSLTNGMQIIEAHLTNDDDALMTFALEVDRLLKAPA